MMLECRPWQPRDADALRPMIRDCLAANFEAGADIAPTDKSVAALLMLGMAWAAKGDPTLIAARHGEVLGYTLWGQFSDANMDLREGLALGLGTYVLPAFRNARVATRLRAAALEAAHARGYTLIRGVTYHDAGLRSCMAAGFYVTGHTVEVRA